MTDAIQATGDISLVENFSNDTIEVMQDVAQVAAAIQIAEVPAAVEAVAEVPNGFVTLGLAPELIQAVKDLGFTQPTTVQLKTIPLAMQGHGAADESARFIDLMVSSQTGSGKTAAFLLPVLHTLLTQMAQAEAKEKADFEQAVAEAAAKGEAPPKLSLIHI